MESERSKRTHSLLLWTLVAGLLSQNFVISTATFYDQKNYYYSPDPGSPPSVSHGSPPSHGTPGGGYGNPPSHGGGGSTPTNCGIPPPSGGGGHHHHHNPTPAPPSGGGGGGYHGPPSTPTPTPIIGSPPTTPIVVPGTPSISVPTPPFDPNSPPFSGTCNFWGSHPGLIWGIFGWWGTLGQTFGLSNLPGYASTMTLPQALTNPRSDGFGSLYREGTASLLNSMVNKRFPYTTEQVRDRFIAAVGSNRAAAAQAHLFKLANEGRIKPRP